MSRSPSQFAAPNCPTASFAGQHESYLNIRGPRGSSWMRAGAASPRCLPIVRYAIIDNGFDHFKVALSVAVMKMVRSDLRRAA